MDEQFHMNNGRYFWHCDFGRLKLLAETGMLEVMEGLKPKAYTLVAASTIRYRRSLELFEKFTLETELVHFDEKNLYIQQRAISLKDDFIYCYNEIVDRGLKKLETINSTNCKLFWNESTKGCGDDCIIKGYYDNEQLKPYSYPAIRNANLLSKLSTRPNGLPNETSFYTAMLTTKTEDDLRHIYALSLALEEEYLNRDRICLFFSKHPDRLRFVNLGIRPDYSCKERWAAWYLNIKPGYQANVERNVEGLLEPVITYNDGKWTEPYYDCRGTDIWMVTYSSPVFKYENGTFYYLGSSIVDVGLTNFDVNQCDQEHKSNSSVIVNLFRGTHNCDRNSTDCKPIKGLGFRTGTFECISSSADFEDIPQIRKSLAPWQHSKYTQAEDTDIKDSPDNFVKQSERCLSINPSDFANIHQSEVTKWKTDTLFPKGYPDVIYKNMKNDGEVLLYFTKLFGDGSWLPIETSYLENRISNALKSAVSSQHFTNSALKNIPNVHIKGDRPDNIMKALHSFFSDLSKEREKKYNGKNMNESYLSDGYINSMYKEILNVPILFNQTNKYEKFKTISWFKEILLDLKSGINGYYKVLHRNEIVTWISWKTLNEFHRFLVCRQWPKIDGCPKVCDNEQNSCSKLAGSIDDRCRFEKIDYQKNKKAPIPILPGIFLGQKSCKCQKGFKWENDGK
ncbi:DgyrCDS7876 [Dimorphilus gyrociliatus]|uniref:DgyrCDS7876 n=1 Tax=Dimorphilus gyrociliatus TaxID=2664684 RepID=A0A7I8VUW7_9ANNE|nr:DgyrCDS7876 [Dimorphilus gyrociliatus]